MFIEVGSRQINLRYVVEIRRLNRDHGEDNVSVVLHDGSSFSGFMTESALSAITEQVVPAHPGYDAHRDDLVFDDAPPPLEWKPVVAFIYHPDAGILQPITAEDGRLDQFAVRLPNGKIYTSHETFFENADEYGAYLVKEFSKKSSGRAERSPR